MEEQQQDNPLGMSGSVIKAFKNELIMFMITINVINIPRIIRMGMLRNSGELDSHGE